MLLKDLRHGSLVRVARRGFKLAVVISWAGNADSVRVRVWRAVSKRWTGSVR
jgi:hypothetical protein